MDSDLETPAATGPLATAGPVLARLGWAVVPLHSVRPDGRYTCEPHRDGKECRARGKHPRVSDWPDMATTDPEQIAAWAARYPGANLGIATGTASGMIALDVDPKNGGPDSLAELIANHGSMPATTRQITGSGGEHWYFKAPPGMAVTNSAGKLGRGLDVRGDGGLVVVAPSRSDKGPYRWVPGCAPWETPPAECPPWLVARLGRAPAPKGPVPDGARGSFPPASAEVLAAAREALAQHGIAVDGMGGGLHTVHAAAILTHDFALTDEEAWPLFLEWNATCVPPWEPDELRERLSRGRKYGKLPYGCRRTMDTLAAARKIIADWESQRSDDPSPMFATFRQLQWADKATRALAVKELHNATGIPIRDLDIPKAVDVEALAAREERQRAFASESSDLLDPSEPLDVARRFLVHTHDAEKRPEFVRWAGDFWRARGTHYEQMSDETIHAALYAFTDTKRDVSSGAPIKPDRSFIEEVAHALKAESRVEVATPPEWLDSKGSDAAASDVIAFPNGLLTLTDPRRFLEPTRRFFNINRVGFPYDPDAPEPSNWIRFLADVWPEDVDAIELLQEFMGLTLTADTSHQKILLVLGPPRSGKGTINRVIQALVGDGYCSPTLGSLGGQFGVEPLIGKRLAVITDARLGRADPSAIAERLLSISGEDAQTIERKYKAAWTAKLSARFIIMTNELPALLDSSGAFASRFRVVQMTRSFLGREDRGLSTRLLKELPGILLWALKGLDRLRESGSLCQPKSAAEAVEQLEMLSSPIRAFVKERCEMRPGTSVECGYLFNEWLAWNRANNREQAGTRQIFGRNLLAAFPQIKRSQPRDGDKRVRMYEGITLLPLEIDIAT